MNRPYYLVIRADRTVRVLRSLRTIAADEVAVKVWLTFPESWGKVVGEVHVDVPDFAPEVRYEQVEP